MKKILLIGGRMLLVALVIALFILLACVDCAIGQEANVTLQCNTANVMADGMVVRWGPPNHWDGEQRFAMGTNFTVSDVDLSVPERFQIAYYWSNVSVVRYGTNATNGTNVTKQFAVTNQVTVGPWSASAKLFTPEMELYCWKCSDEIVVCWWGEAGYGYRLLAGPTPKTATNEVFYEFGTNGPCIYSAPLTNQCFFRTNVFDEPSG